MPEQIRPGQRLALIKLCARCGAQSRGERLYLASRLLGRDIDTFNALTLADWRRIRDYTYPNWSNDDWEVGQTMLDHSARILRRYREQVMGQLSLLGTPADG